MLLTGFVDSLDNDLLTKCDSWYAICLGVDQMGEC